MGTNPHKVRGGKGINSSQDKNLDIPTFGRKISYIFLAS